MKKPIRIIAILLALVFCLTTTCAAVNPLPYPKFRAWHPTTAAPLAGGKLWSYNPGTETLKNTYSDSGLTTPNTNPVILDSYGEASVYLSGSTKLILKTSADVSVWTMDNVTTPNDYFIDAAAYGSNQAGIEAAITAIGVNNRTLNLSPATWSITGDLTIPSNIALRMDKGAVLSIATTKTLTINGSLEAGLYQIFSCTGTGKVVFGSKHPTLWVNWWGSDATAMQLAVTCAKNSGGGVVELAQGVYTFATSTLIDPTGGSITIKLNGSSITYTGAAPSNPFCFSLLSNFWGAGGSENQKIDFDGGGAIFVGNPSASGLVKATDCMNYYIHDFSGVDFTTGCVVLLYVSVDDESRWAEGNIVERVYGYSNNYGIETGILNHHTSTSFDQTVIRDCHFTLNQDNAVGYVLRGYHGRSTFSNLGGWIDAVTYTGNTMFFFDGYFPNAILINPWVDGGGTAANCIAFGISYTATNPDSDQTNNLTLMGGIGQAGQRQLTLPVGWTYKLNVVNAQNQGDWFNGPAGVPQFPGRTLGLRYRYASPTAFEEFVFPLYFPAGTPATYQSVYAEVLSGAAVYDIQVTGWSQATDKVSNFARCDAIGTLGIAAISGIGGLKTVTLGAGGTGYTPGTVTLTVVQAGASGGTITATASGGGVITSIDSIVTWGSGYSVENGLATTGGGGTGCTVNLTAASYIMIQVFRNPGAITYDCQAILKVKMAKEAQ